MPFDIYLDEERVFIDHHEEHMFDLINEDDNYPQLNWIWEEFYNGPVIYPNIANDLVHELIALRQRVVQNKEYKYLTVPIDRIMPLLSKAYKSGQLLNCMSD